MFGGSEEIRVALVGQPNSGKSTLFNSVCGFKVNTGNFPGTTVSFTETKVVVRGRRVRLVDLPGIYSITSHDLAEKVTRDYLLEGKVDLVINVLDASMLARSLELTLQLTEMKVPIILALNMMDEAQKKGVEVNRAQLSHLTGLAVFPVVATRGEGVKELFEAAVDFRLEHFTPVPPVYDRDVEESLARLVASYPPSLNQELALDPRFVVIRLLEMDHEFERRVARVSTDFLSNVQAERLRLAQLHQWPEESVFGSHRHAIVLNLYEKVATHKHRDRPSFRDRLDSVLMNPLGSCLVILASLLLIFYVSFWLGNSISDWMSRPFVLLYSWIKMIPYGGPRVLVTGLAEGVEAGLGIVLPYLIPLLFLFAVYEDSGMLARVAFIVDGALHRVGLHGKSVVPIILGYGCNVPALMATRNLESEAERRLAMLLIPFVACSARSVVILALVGKYLGAVAAILVYVGNLGLIFFVSYGLSKLNVHFDSGLVMEVPVLRRPFFGVIAKKVWLQLRQFIVLAWPIIIVASVALSLASLLGVDDRINRWLAPLTTGLMKLPPSVGIALFLGIFRKELTIVMIATALGTENISAVLTTQQMVTLTVFTVLYIPCLATLTTLWREGGWRTCLLSVVLNLSVALAVAGAVARLRILF